MGQCVSKQNKRGDPSHQPQRPTHRPAVTPPGGPSQPLPPTQAEDSSLQLQSIAVSIHANEATVQDVESENSITDASGLTEHIPSQQQGTASHSEPKGMPSVFSHNYITVVCNCELNVQEDAEGEDNIQDDSDETENNLSQLQITASHPEPKGAEALHHVVLRSLHNTVQDRLNVARVVILLWQKRVITQKEWEKLNRTLSRDLDKPTNCSQELMELLMRDEDHFWMFLDVLLQTGQNELFWLLDECYKKKAKKDITAAGKPVKCFKDFAVNYLKKQLKSLYSSDSYSHVTRKPWVDQDFVHLDDIFINLELEQRNEHREIKKKTYENYSHIFKDCEQKSNRFVVCGNPGSGKSTLSQKVAYDWARGDEEMQQFQLLFLVKLREIANNNISCPIFSSLKECKISQESFSLVTDQCKVLLILDGLDEIQDKAEKSPIIKVITSKSWKSSHCLVTTRPHALSHILDSPSASANQFNIQGFNREDFRKYVAMYFSHLNDKEVEKIQNEIEEAVRETGVGYLIEIPFCTLLLCFVHETLDQMGKSLPNNASELYCQVVNSFEQIVRKKYPKSSQDDYVKSIKLISHFAFDMLISEQEGKLIFSDQEVSKYFKPEIACSIGLLVRVESYKGKPDSANLTKPLTFFSFVHKSVQEYLAAKYIVQGDVNESNDIEEKIRNYITWEKLKYKSDLFLQFVSELCNSKDTVNSISAEIILCCEKMYVKEFCKENEKGRLSKELIVSLEGYGQSVINLFAQNNQNPVQTLFLHKGYWLNMIMSKHEHLRDLKCVFVEETSSFFSNKVSTLFEKYIKDIFCNSENLEYAGLSGNIIRDISSILALCIKCPQIKCLLLRKCNIKSKELMVILRNLFQYKQLKILDISENDLSDDVEGQSPDMSVYKNITMRLEEVAMYRCKAPSWLIQIVLKVVQSAPTLTKLDLGYYQLDKQNTIDCNNADLSSENIMSIILNVHKWPNIKCIDLRYNRQAPSTQPPVPQDMSVYDNITLGLEELAMYGCKAPSWLIQIVLKVVQSAPSLTKLDLGSFSDRQNTISCDEADLSSENIISIISNIHKWPNIRCIDLRYNRQAPSTQPPELTDMSMYANITLGLEELDMSGCKAPYWLIEMVLKVVQAAPSLTQLDLGFSQSHSHNTISCRDAGLSSDNIISIISNIHKWPNIRDINLINNPQAPSTQPPVLPDMSVYDNISLGLEKLDMYGCKAPFWLMKLLLPIIKSSTELKYLYLGGNNMSLLCMTDIISNIHEWPNIECIDLSDNPQDPSTRPLIPPKYNHIIKM